jgi:hypothetical protein
LAVHSPTIVRAHCPHALQAKGVEKRMPASVQSDPGYDVIQSPG